jgi:hypothetical protein
LPPSIDQDGHNAYSTDDLLSAIEYGEAHATRKALEAARDAMCWECDAGLRVDDHDKHHDLRAPDWAGHCAATPIRSLLASLPEGT